MSQSGGTVRLEKDGRMWNVLARRGGERFVLLRTSDHARASTYACHVEYFFPGVRYIHTAADVEKQARDLEQEKAIARTGRSLATGGIVNPKSLCSIGEGGCIIPTPRSGRQP